MKTIAIIPARGGSKRIPKKNIKTFFGNPIISYSILAALNSGLYDEVMVSTDDEDIAKMALKYGAKVPFMRSKENSNDFATTVDVIIEVLDWYKENENTVFEQSTCIYACAPFVNPKLLKRSFELLNAKDADCVFPILSYSHPIQRALILQENGSVLAFRDVNPNARTQDLTKTYHDAGMFYTFNVPKLYLSKSLRTEDSFAIEISELLAHDIDSEEDWLLAEMKYKLFANEII
ncbi:pseudaminic acid cytidylyltransferase [Pedobacter sp. LMG 31464]|uniref:Pseudaminic acid cytidylyltransferase n=1 Tax=Pedobacter planticolens TaxID=2679964 RepID=A0A923DZF2_9SPHI|nr:pseudaminic acid cytidylyltransferase [Pedobacter planticolens]MBB2145930.1 pseudaminic acid cytidylyltransferase [Pedobacter planticolens]